MVQSSLSVEQLANPSSNARAYSRTRGAASRADTRTQHEHSRIRQLDWILLVLFLLGSVALLLRGWQFYTLTVGERVDHPDFRVLGPSTSLGRAYGVAGFLMILTNLTYLVRRRFAGLSLGSLRAWLDVHTFTGLFGGLLVVFHSAFQVRTTIAVITVASLFVALITGLIGRSIYALTPKPDSARLARLLGLLDQVGPGMGQVLSQRVATVARAAAPRRYSLLYVLSALPDHLRELRQRRVIVERTVAEYGHYFAREVRALARPIAECRSMYASEVRAAIADALLRSWRGIHRLSALLMVLLVIMHIVIAWYYGFVWALSR